MVSVDGWLGAVEFVGGTGSEWFVRSFVVVRDPPTLLFVCLFSVLRTTSGVLLGDCHANGAGTLDTYKIVIRLFHFWLFVGLNICVNTVFCIYFLFFCICLD